MAEIWTGGDETEEETRLRIIKEEATDNGDEMEGRETVTEETEEENGGGNGETHDNEESAHNGEDEEGWIYCLMIHSHSMVLSR